VAGGLELDALIAMGIEEAIRTDADAIAVMRVHERNEADIKRLAGYVRLNRLVRAYYY
jgi:hypothetical protein